ncbi:Mannose-6-phosphate isomerase / Mannose-1-phosphate guanylyl transferase [Beijerinckiaceae bacterium RH AL1]|nr:mannose-1-phosphate guanylyltransferase/mannose-6-phosphate isomerase [Beijerinckiaceae bacterium]VVB49288.1 Mannose-6-phosphate isomerase / Mannose-1-phosphate guanylyl transferase [Beijerinckiaceae bacterium RH CH11]VVB49367.1 Mannose-6-phosphate isomerase / Mannose-1-phosphate guanylyl transferase [Beijerinckiaceae bacterium RH AL8]VVC56825.1 Mannose-6-phosphate isomerase / Mannose-1-phosphate guanylyl transferase [Beijerinckiaceae bacterium RH AL1]
MKILPVIMCGGSGTRVWPESRESLPKQFIPLVGERSTFQMAIDVLSDDVFNMPVVVSNHAYRFLVGEQLQKIGRTAHIVLEPQGRDSGPAVAVAAELALRMAPDTIVAVLAADHVVQDKAGFVKLCREAAEAARGGRIVTLGIKPDHPATGYGYIKPGHALVDGGEVRELERFVEKPDRATAERYIAEGYLWNSGNFFFRADVMEAELRAFEPEMITAAAEALNRSRTDLDFTVLDAEAFQHATKKSIDYAVMERTTKAAVVPADIGWSDVGNWAAVWQLSDRDADGNSIRGHGALLDAKNVHIRSDEHLTTVVGVDNVIVVTTHDAVLVVGKEHGDKVKQLVEKLRGMGRREATEHKRSYRPWGYYQSIDNGARYQVKRIVVKPGAALSLQKHYHRAEHWVVVKGIAEVTRGNELVLVHENESIFLPMGVIHRMANPGKINLELIEVQTGSYLGEDDIIRIEDVYNRH